MYTPLTPHLRDHGVLVFRTRRISEKTMWQSLRRLITTLVPSGWSVENILQISNTFSFKKTLKMMELFQDQDIFERFCIWLYCLCSKKTFPKYLRINFSLKYLKFNLKCCDFADLPIFFNTCLILYSQHILELLHNIHKRQTFYDKQETSLQKGC